MRPYVLTQPSSLIGDADGNGSTYGETAPTAIGV
jgi:hypothetical protein